MQDWQNDGPKTLA